MAANIRARNDMLRQKGKKDLPAYGTSVRFSPPSLVSLRRVCDDGSLPEFSDKRGFAMDSWWEKSGQNLLKNNSCAKNNLAIMKLFVKSTNFIANLAKFPFSHSC